jgi:acyl-CoA thioesterase I
MEKSVTRYDTYGTRNMLYQLRVLAVCVILATPACSSNEAAAERSAPPPSTPAAAAASAPVATRPRIVFLGDSLTAGYGLDVEQSVPSLVQKHLDAEGYKFDVVNAGVSGDTSAGGLRRLDWSLEGDVRILVVELGANDGLRGLPVADMKRNLKTIVQTAKKRGIDVLLTGMEAPPNYGAAYTSEFRRAFRDVAAEERVAFMPFYLYEVAGIPTLNIADGIHPNPAGARIVEANLWRSLKPLLENQRR